MLSPSGQRPLRSHPRAAASFVPATGALYRKLCTNRIHPMLHTMLGRSHLPRSEVSCFVSKIVTSTTFISSISCRFLAPVAIVVYLVIYQGRFQPSSPLVIHFLLSTSSLSCPASALDSHQPRDAYKFSKTPHLDADIPRRPCNRDVHLGKQHTVYKRHYTESQISFYRPRDSLCDTESARQHHTVPAQRLQAPYIVIMTRLILSTS